jgi:hypothetical protein
LFQITPAHQLNKKRRLRAFFLWLESSEDEGFGAAGSFQAFELQRFGIHNGIPPLTESGGMDPGSD